MKNLRVILTGLRYMVALLAIILAIIISSCDKTDNNSLNPSAKNGDNSKKPAPEFSINDSDGKIVNLRDNKGKVVLIEFWATWCSPCRESISELNSISTMFKDKPVIVLAINIDDGAGTNEIREFMSKNNIKYRVLLASDKVKMDYHINSIPVTFIIDKDMNVDKVYMGYAPELQDILIKDIKALL